MHMLAGVAPPQMSYGAMSTALIKPLNFHHSLGKSRDSTGTFDTKT